MQQQHSFAEDSRQGTLYMVPTPIGNLEDMSFRAVQTLKDVDLILAEDTRHTQKLLNHFGIDTPQKSFHKFNSKERMAEVLASLEAGKNLAQVSDAGMPVISDPGADLVAGCIQAGIKVVPLPGPNAGLTGLIASGLRSDSFTFLGFPPRKDSEQLAFLEKYVNQPETLIFYESPHRLTRTLSNCCKVFGGDRRAVVARELTKTYEEFNRGTLAELADYWRAQDEVKGEICLYVEGNPNPQDADDIIQASLDGLSLADQVKWWMNERQMSSKVAIKKVARQNGLAKQEVYKAYHVDHEE